MPCRRICTCTFDQPLLSPLTITTDPCIDKTILWFNYIVFFDAFEAQLRHGHGDRVGSRRGCPFAVPVVAGCRCLNRVYLVDNTEMGFGTLEN